MGDGGKKRKYNYVYTLGCIIRTDERKCEDRSKFCTYSPKCSIVCKGWYVYSYMLQEQCTVKVTETISNIGIGTRTNIYRNIGIYIKLLTEGKKKPNL